MPAFAAEQGIAASTPEIPAVMHRALNAGLAVNVYSNLVRVAPELWELLAHPGVSLSTSWYSADPARHAQITGSKTAWASTRANIAVAVSRGITVQAAIIDGIVPGQDAEAAEAELRALGVTRIRVRPSQGVGRAAHDGQANDPAELCGHCGIGRAAIMPDGQLVPCVIGRWMNAGNVRQTPLSVLFAAAAWRDALALVPRAADPCQPACPPAGDGSDCPPASQPACAPAYCAPDTGDQAVPLQITMRQVG